MNKKLEQRANTYRRKMVRVVEYMLKQTQKCHMAANCTHMKEVVPESLCCYLWRDFVEEIDECLQVNQPLSGLWVERVRDTVFDVIVAGSCELSIKVRTGKITIGPKGVHGEIYITTYWPAHVVVRGQQTGDQSQVVVAREAWRSVEYWEWLGVYGIPWRFYREVSPWNLGVVEAIIKQTIRMSQRQRNKAEANKHS